MAPIEQPVDFLALEKFITEGGGRNAARKANAKTKETERDHGRGTVGGMTDKEGDLRLELNARWMLPS